MDTLGSRAGDGICSHGFAILDLLTRRKAIRDQRHHHCHLGLCGYSDAARLPKQA